MVTYDAPETLSGTDQFMWSLGSDPVLQSTIVTMTVFAGSPDWDVVVDRFASVAKAVVRFRERVVAPWPGLRPRWSVDLDFDVADHLRRVVTAEPVDLAMLLECAQGMVMAGFDRRRPLWDATLFADRSGDAAALLCRFDHGLTDGLGALDVAEVLYDHPDRPGDDGARPRAPHPDGHERAASSGLLGLQGLGDLAAREAGLARRIVSGWWGVTERAAEVVRDPVGSVVDLVSTAASVYRTARPVEGPLSPIMRSRSAIRRLAVQEVPTADLLAAGHAAGGSLNDAFIAAVTGGLRRYHHARGVAVGDLMLSMPISIRRSADPRGGNRATLARMAVPVDVVDPRRRIQLIRERTAGARHERSLPLTEPIAGALNVVPRAYVASLLRRVDFLASDVPGFAAPVSMGGAPVRMQYAFGPTLGAALNATLLSYADTCAIGFNVDVAAVRDVDLLRDCLAQGCTEVLELAGSS